MVCLHPDHLCDGIDQCPLYEDEFTCDITCPPTCTCLGLEFTCRGHFNASSYPRLKYLDGSRSEIQLPYLASNFDLVFLSLSHCKIRNISNTEELQFPRLIHLDISHNDLVTLNQDFFSSFPALKVLHLGWNKLLPDSELSFKTRPLPLQLRHLDLSGITFSQAWIDNFGRNTNNHLKILNLSFVILEKLPSFRGYRGLEVLDLRIEGVESFPRDILTGFTQLNELYSFNPKLCCTQLLPNHHKSCMSKREEISSCENVLRSNIYRVFAWIFSFVSIISNFIIVIFIFQETKISSKLISNFDILVIMLFVSHALMGVYLLTIAIADGYFRERYLWVDSFWRESLICKVIRLTF